VAHPALTLSSCVGKKKYDAAVAERDAKVASCESNLPASQKKASDLENEKAALLHDQSQLNASIEEMQRAMAEADARKIATEARLEEYRMLLGSSRS
jgi:chromosome segregation ATPase